MTVNVHEAKTHLSKYLEMVENGETVMLSKRNEPIAEIRPLARPKPRKDRVIGLDKGKFTVGPEFFEPLPDEFLKAFGGGND